MTTNLSSLNNSPSYLRNVSGYVFWNIYARGLNWDLALNCLDFVVSFSNCLLFIEKEFFFFSFSLIGPDSRHQTYSKWRLVWRQCQNKMMRQYRHRRISMSWTIRLLNQYSWAGRSIVEMVNSRFDRSLKSLKLPSATFQAFLELWHTSYSY